MAGIFDQFQQQFDPLSTGLSLLATNDGRMNGSQSLGTALLAGRQARLQQIQADTEKNAAAKKAQNEMYAKQGEINKDYALKGYTGMQFPDTTANPNANPYVPTGATYNKALDPSAQAQGAPDFGVNPAQYVNPETGESAVQMVNKAGEVYLADLNGNRIKNTSGFVIASTDPATQAAIAAARAKGRTEGAASAEAGLALPGNLDASNQYKDIIRQYMSYYPVKDIKTGQTIDPTAQPFDPNTMTAGEVNSLASGITAVLPSIRPSAREVDTLRDQIKSREFIDQLIGAKAGGATFGSLTQGEGEKIEGYRTILANPKATARQRASAAYNLFQEVDRATARLNALANKNKPQTNAPTVSNW